LEELYASNNEINNIDSLKNLEHLRVLNLYKNKVSSFEGTYKTLQNLRQLDDLDME
jgi:Leucine-rich repeat (LRR) protein